MKEATVNTKVKDLENHIALENGILLQHLEYLETRFTNIEQRFHFDPEVTIIAQDVPHSPTEDPMEIADNIIREGLNILDVPVVRAKRLDSHNPRKPGLLKREVKNLDQKKKLLKKKRSLRDICQYQDVYVRSSKSHAKRLVELNFQTLLAEIPTSQ